MLKSLPPRRLSPQPGWNFFSLPVIPNNLSISAIFPTFATDFEQISAWGLQPAAWSHYVGNPKFDDFSSLEYGKGYELYCKATSPVTVTLKGKLPTQRLSKSLGVGWYLLPSLSLESQGLSQAFGGVDYEQVQRYDTASSSLTPATDVQPGAAYFVKVRTASTWTPPLPRDVTTSFVYDGDGGKVKQTTASGTTLLVGEVFEKAPSGTTTKYVFAGAERIAAKDSTGALRFYHGDHLGSSNVVTDATGAVVELAEYTPYGSLASRSGTANVAHKFTGQRQDASTGLVLFPGRAYDPSLGRFLQADPFVQDPADPQSLNRYSYVRNNPLNFTDPSGYKRKKRGFFRFFFAAVAAVVVTVITGGHAELGAAIFSAIAVAGAAVVGDQVGAAVDRRASSSSSSSAEASSPRGPPSSTSAAGSPGHGVSFLGPVRYADLVASETLQDSWGPDDAIFLLTGLGASAKAAVTAAREFGPAVLLGLRSLGETGAIRLGADVADTFVEGKFRDVVLKPGVILERAFENGVTRPIGSFTTRGVTATRLTSTETAIRELGLAGTSNARPDYVATLRTVANVRAKIGFIKGGGQRALQVVIHPEDRGLLEEVSRRYIGGP